MKQRKQTLINFKQQYNYKSKSPQRNVLPTCDLWSSKYNQIVLKESQLTKLQDSIEYQKRQQAHERVHRYFAKPNLPKLKKLKDVIPSQNSSYLYGLKNIIQRLDTEQKELSDLSQEVERSLSRETKLDIFKKNRRKNKEQELREMMKTQFLKQFQR